MINLLLDRLAAKMVGGNRAHRNSQKVHRKDRIAIRVDNQEAMTQTIVSTKKPFNPQPQAQAMCRQALTEMV